MNKKIVVGKMIRFFLDKNNMTMKELGKELGKTESTVSKWVSGKSTPLAKDLSKITNIFNVNIETLLYGDQDEHTFSKNLKYLRNKFNMDQQELADKLGRKSTSTISEWEKGKYTPKAGTLSDIAHIFNVKIDDLMSDNLQDNMINNINKADNDINLIYNQLNNRRQECVYNFAKAQLEDQSLNNT